MTVRGSGTERRRLIRAGASGVSKIVAALAEACGMHVLPADAPGDVDLIVAEIGSPEDVRALLAADRGPLLALIARRLRESEAHELRAAGAARVIDAEANLLDAACAVSELVFGSYAEQRRYGRCFGGWPVLFRRVDRAGRGPGREDRGQLLAIARSGGYVRAREVLEEGTRLEIELGLLGRVAVLRGRVAFAEDDGFAVEFALDEHDVASKLRALAIAPVFASSARA